MGTITKSSLLAGVGQKEKKRCKQCGKWKTYASYDNKQDEWCSRCMQRAVAGTCKMCGAAIPIDNMFCSSKKTGKNCADELYWFMVKHMRIVFSGVRPCSECNELFPVHPKNHSSHVCGDECRKERIRRKNREAAQKRRGEPKNTGPAEIKPKCDNECIVCNEFDYCQNKSLREMPYCLKNKQVYGDRLVVNNYHA